MSGKGNPIRPEGRAIRQGYPKVSMACRHSLGKGVSMTDAAGETVAGVDTQSTPESAHSTIHQSRSATRASTIGDTPQESAHEGIVYIYAIGHVEPQFPSVTVEREYAQVVSRYNTEGQTDQQTLQ